MKKKYITPKVRVFAICSSNILTGSNEPKIRVYSTDADDSEML